MSNNALLIKKVLAWYGENQRDLPWRQTHDPYRILVSEVMLQQTQVSRVIEKYKEFLKAFPTAKSLANAKTADVIRVWKGLGYNRRALFLQKTAQAVMGQYKGEFPQEIALLKKLPGIGEYTARAVLCFAFLKPVAVLDTNHRKFYSRVFGQLSDKELLEKADEFIRVIASEAKQSSPRNITNHGLPRRRPAPPRNDITSGAVYDWNQALMDFVSAIERGESDRTIDWFNKTYPLKKDKKEMENPPKADPPRAGKKKISVPFKQTDRYIRGQIIDVLRESSMVSISSLQKRFSEFPKERIEQVVVGLQKDGLILVQKKRIVLP